MRVLRKSPGFTFVAVASLALGIGANTAIFTLVDSLILRALPVREPARLARLQDGSWTNPIWEEIRERGHTLFDGAAAFSDTRLDLAAGGEAQFAEAFFASGEFFDVVGVKAMLGRTLTRDDDRRGGGGAGPVAVISYAFWQRRYGGAGAALGSTLTLNGVPFTIVEDTARLLRTRRPLVRRRGADRNGRPGPAERARGADSTRVPTGGSTSSRG